MQKLLPSDVLALKMDKLEGFYRGIVEDNNSPNGNGECRIRVFGVHTAVKTQSDQEGIPTDQLPWAQQITGLGGNASSTVPKIGSCVFLFFEEGNPLQPRYFGIAPGTEKGNPSVSLPNTNTYKPDGETPPPPEIDQNCDFIGVLTRSASTDQGTPGVLVISTKPKDGSQGQIIATYTTLELPNRNNIADKSCVNAGTYTCTYVPNTGGSATCANTYMIQGTPGRSGCRLHGGMWAGNVDLGYKADVHGCILVDLPGKSGSAIPSGRSKTQLKVGNWNNCSVTQNTLPTLLKKQKFVLTIK